MARNLANVYDEASHWLEQGKSKVSKVLPSLQIPAKPKIEQPHGRLDVSQTWSSRSLRNFECLVDFSQLVRVGFLSVFLFGGEGSEPMSPGTMRASLCSISTGDHDSTRSRFSTRSNLEKLRVPLETRGRDSVAWTEGFCRMAISDCPSGQPSDCRFAGVNHDLRQSFRSTRIPALQRGQPCTRGTGHKPFASFSIFVGGRLSATRHELCFGVPCPAALSALCKNIAFGTMKRGCNDVALCAFHRVHALLQPGDGNAKPAFSCASPTFGAAVRSCTLRAEVYLTSIVGQWASFWMGPNGFLRFENCCLLQRR